MASKPYFSVVIPWHSTVDELIRAVSSIKSQSVSDYEIIVVANGPAVQFVEQATSVDDLSDCVFLIHQAPCANGARNLGIDNARGRWIAFLDVDDVFLPSKLECLGRNIRSAPGIGIWISRGLRRRHAGLRAIYPRMVYEAGQNIAEYFFVHGNNCSVTAMVVRADIAAAIRFTSLETSQDDPDFLIRAQGDGHAIAMIGSPLYEWQDERAQHRRSRHCNTVAERRWVASLRSTMGDRAYFAFLARRVGQHALRREFRFAVGAMVEGYRKGGIGALESILLFARGILPRPISHHLINAKVQLDGYLAAKAKSARPPSPHPIGRRTGPVGGKTHNS